MRYRQKIEYMYRDIVPDDVDEVEFEFLFKHPLDCATRMALAYVKRRELVFEERDIAIAAAASLAYAAFSLDDSFGVIYGSDWLSFAHVSSGSDKVKIFTKYQLGMLGMEDADVCKKEMFTLRGGRRKSQKRKSPRKRRTLR